MAGRSALARQCRACAARTGASPDALGRTTRWSYDNLGRLSTRTLPLGQLERFDYDAFGHLAAKTDFNGSLTTYTNDAMGRRVRTDYPDGAWLEVTYNHADQPLTLNLSGQVETRSYDGRGRLSSVQYPDGQRIDYQYDAVGNRTKLTTNTRVVDYGYDALNRLVTVTEQPSAALAQGTAKVTRYAYDAVGNRAAIEHANGTRVDYTYNRRNQLTQMLHQKAATVLLSLGYLLNPDGSRAAIIEQTHALDAQQQPVLNADGAPVLEPQRRTDYTYDAVKRLVAESVDAANDDHDRATTWTYDAVGNRQTQSQLRGAGASVGAAPGRDSTTYTYDANDRLLTETKATTTNGQTVVANTQHRYDLNGNLVETIGGEGTQRYRWTAENRLAQHEKTANGQTAITQYAYTADGIRNRIIANATTVAAVTTRQLIDPNQAYAQVIEETIQLGANPPQLKTVFTHGDDLIAQHALRNSDGTLATSGSSILHYDGLGTTRFLTNAAGDITDRYTYQAFGDLDEAATTYAFGSTAATDYLFTGEQFDPNLGFYYLRARYMDPSNGRFASLDTYAGNSSDPVTLHKYLYANADPVAFIDPTGRFSLVEMMISTDVQGVLRTSSTAAGRRAFKRILFGHPPQDVGVVGEMVLDWILQGFFEHLQDGGLTKQEFGQRVHRDLKNKCEAFRPLGNVRLVCEPFYDDARNEYGHAKKGTLGVDVMIYEGMRRVIAIELKTGKGMNDQGFKGRRKRMGTSVIQITLKGDRG